MNQMSLQNSSWTYLIRGFRAIAFAILPGLLCAQGTRIEMPKNKYNVQDDVKLGREAAARPRWSSCGKPNEFFRARSVRPAADETRQVRSRARWEGGR